MLEGRREIDHTLPANIINPDVIAHELNPDDPDAVERKAGEAAIKARDVAFANREDFGIETTLTGFGVPKLIANAKNVIPRNRSLKPFAKRKPARRSLISFVKWESMKIRFNSGRRNIAVLELPKFANCGSSAKETRSSKGLSRI